VGFTAVNHFSIFSFLIAISINNCYYLTTIKQNSSIFEVVVSNKIKLILLSSISSISFILFYWLTNVRESDTVFGVSSDLSDGLVMGFAIGVMLITLSTFKLNKYWVFLGNKRLKPFASLLPNNVVVPNYFMSPFLDTTNLPCLLKISNLKICWDWN